MQRRALLMVGSLPFLCSMQIPPHLETWEYLQHTLIQNSDMEDFYIEGLTPLTQMNFRIPAAMNSILNSELACIPHHQEKK